MRGRCKDSMRERVVLAWHPTVRAVRLTEEILSSKAGTRSTSPGTFQNLGPRRGRLVRTIGIVLGA